MGLKMMIQRNDGSDDCKFCRAKAKFTREGICKECGKEDKAVEAFRKEVIKVFRGK